MKVAFNIPDTTVDIAVAMIRAKAVNNSPEEKQTVVLIGLAIAAITACLNTK